MRTGSQVINLVSQFLPSKQVQHPAIYEPSELFLRCAAIVLLYYKVARSRAIANQL